MISATDDAPETVPDDATAGARGPVPSAHHGPSLLLIGAVVAVALLALGVRAIEPNGPGPFYAPPAPLPSDPPGSIIRSEPLPTAPAGSRGWRVLYRSTSPQGTPIAVSGVVFAPNPAPPSGDRPVVAWAHPTTGVASSCAPSIAPDGGAPSIAGLAGLLRAGYVVTATDYPGLGTPGPHPYLVGESEARAVLDSVRAAHELDGAGAGTTFAVWGHSQGGHAALFAGQAAAGYAPDLDLVGIAAAAPATELAELLQRDIGGVTGNVLASMALVSWSDVYADRDLSLDRVVETADIPLVRLIADRCIETDTHALLDLPAAEILRIGFIEGDPWSIPPWDEVLAENTPGTGAAGAPILITQGTADTVVWPGVTERWIATRCRTGGVADERLYPGRTHTEIATASAADAQAWIADRFAGRDAPSICPPPPGDAAVAPSAASR